MPAGQSKRPASEIADNEKKSAPQETELFLLRPEWSERKFAQNKKGNRVQLTMGTN
jgi:hypothetical protein